MKDLKDAIYYVKTVNATFQFEREQLLCAFKHLFCHAMESGLEDGTFKILAYTLTATNLPVVCVEDLVKCLIPRTTVPDSVVTDIALWLLSKEPDVTPGKVSLVLRWFTGVVNNGLVDSSKLENLYELFFNLIRIPGIDPQACSFIQCLTKQQYITRRHILVLMELQQKGKKRHFESLLGLFKRMRPNLVPEYVSACDHPCLTTLDISEPGFQLARQRCALKTGSASSSDIVKHPPLHVAKVHTCQSIIPQIIYTELCCNHSQVYKISDIDRWESIGACSVDLEMPIQSLALLRCSFGVFSLAFGGADIQRRFSLTLQSKLYSVFLSPENELSHWNPQVRCRSEARLLHQLSTLQEYLHQPIPVVSCFLSKYLPLWDGDTHRLLILRLLSYLHFSTFEELESCILDPISLLFLTKDVQFKCNIINMLREFMKNLILKDQWRKGKEPLFLGVKRCWQAEDVYPKIFEFISDLIEMGVSSENGSSFLLSSALSYYHMMVTLQKDVGISYLVMPPPAVIYHSLFSHNPVCLSLSCSLLVRYKTELYPLLKDSSKLNDILGTLTAFVTDYANFLCTDKPFLNRSEGYIFRNLKDATIKALSQLMGAEPSSGINNHIALVPFLYIYSQSNTPTNFEVLSRTTEKRLPGIAEFIKAYGAVES
ncbi:centromere protein I-like [Ischnura elegans]|uniref:centromere protein I-like n=1 Tax=Ischnura elegans TaxID=197161 RepID=UPI001ED893FA|nr:centromere protein I-like [Ischnura elegans]